MNPHLTVLSKPTVDELLHQITPFVMNEKHEQEFQRRFDERKALAIILIRDAQRGRLNNQRLMLLIQQNAETLGSLISLLGLSQEEFFRHVTLARLEKLSNPSEAIKFSEWKMDQIIRQMKADESFSYLVLDGFAHF